MLTTTDRSPNRWLLERVWAAAIRFAVRLKKHTSNHILENSTTLFEVLHMEKPNLLGLHK